MSTQSNTLPRDGYRLSITLANGDRYSYGVAKMPRHWKSWLMQRLPYGLDVQGATFERVANG